MRRSLSLWAVGLFASTALLLGSSLAAVPVSAATLAATTTCANGVDDTPGLGIICEVTIVNTITSSGGSATVTVRECHGAAGDPQASCSTDTQVLSAPVTAVDQCNDATNGGGGTLRCSVRVTNLFAVDPNPGAVTVNQCVGSGDGDSSGCDPFPATTTGATITQCNGSANGGTLVGLTCTASGTEASALNVAINQCNGSTNGGGALVICSAQIVNRLDAPAPTASPAGSSAGGGGHVPSATLPPTDSLAPVHAMAGTASSVPALFALIGLLAILALSLTVRRSAHH